MRRGAGPGAARAGRRARHCWPSARPPRRMRMRHGSRGLRQKARSPIEPRGVSGARRSACRRPGIAQVARAELGTRWRSRAAWRGRFAAAYRSDVLDSGAEGAVDFPAWGACAGLSSQRARASSAPCPKACGRSPATRAARGMPHAGAPRQAHAAPLERVRHPPLALPRGYSRPASIGERLHGAGLKALLEQLFVEGLEAAVLLKHLVKPRR